MHCFVETEYLIFWYFNFDQIHSLKYLIVIFCNFILKHYGPFLVQKLLFTKIITRKLIYLRIGWFIKVQIWIIVRRKTKKVINLSVRITTTFIRIYMNAKLKQIIETIIYYTWTKNLLINFHHRYYYLQFWNFFTFLNSNQLQKKSE